jgi:hypothetical protein
MPLRRFPKPWTVEQIPSGYRVLDANGRSWRMSMSNLMAPLPGSNKRLTNDEARRISKLIARLPGVLELEKDRNKPRSRQR